MPMKPPQQRQPWQGSAVEERRKAKADLDRRRGSAAARGYDAAWRRLRAAFLAANPLCRMCEAEGRTTAAGVVDHIRPIAERPDLRLEWSNLQSLCQPHHDRDKQREDRRRGRWAVMEEQRMPTGLMPSRIPLTIVTGPPGAGKSTYVRQRIGPSDLLICLDTIISRITGLREHADAPGAIAQALEVRNGLLHSLSRDTEHAAAWFIVSAPSPEERKRWARMLGGNLVVIDTPFEECVRRIRADPGRAERSRAMINAAARWWALNQRGSRDATARGAAG